MSDLEQNLRAARLAAPSADLDRRIDEAFLAAAQTRRTSRKVTLGWWLASLAALGSAAAWLLVSTRPPRPAAQPVIYRFEAQGPMRQLLLEPPQNATLLPHFIIHTSPP